MGKRFLIGQLACFGDCLYATTLAKQIKHDYPDSHITWAVATRYKSILELNPYIDRIWEVPVKNGDYQDAGWAEFESEALRRKDAQEFDEVIFSQIPPRNWVNFTGTIRGTILSSYQRPITVSVEPVLRLSNEEVARVKQFAIDHELQKFRQVVLFECSPGSEQSRLNPAFALQVAQAVSQDDPEICFILSTSERLPVSSPQIIDASALTFRENAELTHYCTLLIGCSSGITWLATSDWAKELPMLQLLDKNYKHFAGVRYDLAINGLSNAHVIELLKFDQATVIACLKSMLTVGVTETAKTFQQKYVPRRFNVRQLVKVLLTQKKSFAEIHQVLKRYYAKNGLGKLAQAESKTFLSYVSLVIYAYYASHIRYTEAGLFFQLRTWAKRFFLSRNPSNGQSFHKTA